MNKAHIFTICSHGQSNEWHQLHRVKFTGKEIGCDSCGKLSEVEDEQTLCAVKEIHSASISKSHICSQDKILQDNRVNDRYMEYISPIHYSVHRYDIMRNIGMAITN